MTIDNEGYLSKDMVNIQMGILEKSSEYFELARKVNKHAHSLKFMLDIHSRNAQEVIAASILVSLLESFNSIYILSSQGLVSDSKIILRSLLEKTLKLKYIVLSYENASNYIRQSEINRLKLMNVILNDQQGSFSETVKKAIKKEERDLLSKQIKNEEIPSPLKIEELAQKTGMLVYYNNVYRLLNDDVHSNSSSLARFIETNEMGDITKLNWFSSFNDITSEVNIIIFTAIALLISSIESINELFKIEDEKLGSLINEIDVLSEPFKS